MWLALSYYALFFSIVVNVIMSPERPCKWLPCKNCYIIALHKHADASDKPIDQGALH